MVRDEAHERGEGLVQRPARLAVLRLRVLERVALLLVVHYPVVHDLPSETQRERVRVIRVPALPNKEVPVAHHPVLGERARDVVWRDGGVAQLQSLTVVGYVR